MFTLCLAKPLSTRWRFYSYLHHIGNYPFQYKTQGQILEKSALKFGERDAIISVQQNKKFTYKEALKKSDKLAAGFLNLGLQKGDRVGMWCPNLIEWFTVKYACARAGLTLVALNPSYQIPEIEYSMNKVGIKCLICPDKVKKMHFYDMLCGIIPDLNKSQVGNIKSERTPSLKCIITISEDVLGGTYNYQEVAECSDQNLIDNIKKSQDSISPDSIFTILFSSGTTGKPKAAMVSHFSHVNNALDLGRRIELNKKHHKVCMMVPFFHAFGVTISCCSSICYGATIVLPSPTYSPSDNLTSIVNNECTMIHGTPTMHLDLITEQQKRNEDISPEIALSGGAPISAHQFKTMLEVLKLRTVKSVYGLTETTSMVFSSKPGDDIEKSVTTVGYLSDNTEVKIVGANGKIVPFGSPGELYIRGYQNMMGYWEDNDKTEATLGSDGWLKTGDQFILTEDGYGKIVGRIKDMIIRGGENIFPKEVEDVLVTHPKIAEVNVIGLPHARLGEEVCACVILKENSELTLQTLSEFCKGKMAHFKIPSQLRLVNNFSKTGSGKIQKYLLVKQFSENTTQD